MRVTILCLLAIACSGKKDDKPSAGGAQSSPSGDQGGALPADMKQDVKGALEVTGPFPGTYTWKPDLALICGCSVKENKGVADFTMSDDGGKTFISGKADMDGTVTVRTGTLPAGMSGTGVKGSCKGGEWAQSALHLEIDADIKAPTGETGHVKGSLDFTCP